MFRKRTVTAFLSSLFTRNAAHTPEVSSNTKAWKEKTKNLILLKDTKFMKEISWRVHIETFLLLVVDPER